jgi:hypothetical protein
MKIRLQPGKTEYTEIEAARALGISAAQFRSLLLRHVVDEEDALSNIGLMRFRPSDLLLLSMFKEEVKGQEPGIRSHKPE